MKWSGRRMGRGALAAATLAAATLAVAGISLIRADSIYYRKDKDGNIQLTNAPDDRGYHTYMSGSSAGSSRSVYGPYADHIQSAAREYGLDPNLVRAVIATESNFDPRAVSPKGARGLMQLMPSTATRFGVTNVEDPRQNIQGGTQYLRHLLDLFGGDLVLALAAYNAGERIVQSRGRVPEYRETRDYVDRVLTTYGRPRVGSGSRSRSDGRVIKAPPRKSPIYRAVSEDGTLEFSDSPTPKPVKD